MATTAPASSKKISEATAPRARRTQAERRETTRAQLIAATIECINELGLEGTTTERISKRAGVTRGALNHHFEDRSDLLLAVCEQTYQRFAEAVTISVSTADPVETRVDKLMHAIWREMLGPSYRAMLEIAFATRNDREMHAKLFPFVEQITQHSIDEWQRLFADQGIQRRLMEDLHDQCTALLSGMVVLSSFLDPRCIERQLQLFRMMVLNALRNPAAFQPAKSAKAAETPNKRPAAKRAKKR